MYLQKLCVLIKTHTHTYVQHQLATSRIHVAVRIYVLNTHAYIYINKQTNSATHCALVKLYVSGTYVKYKYSVP